MVFVSQRCVRADRIVASTELNSESHCSKSTFLACFTDRRKGKQIYLQRCVAGYELEDKAQKERFASDYKFLELAIVCGE